LKGAGEKVRVHSYRIGVLPCCEYTVHLHNWH